MEFVDIKNDILWAQAEMTAREQWRLDRERLDAELNMIVKNRTEEVARNMIAMGCENEMIAQVVELPVEEVERLRRELD